MHRSKTAPARRPHRPHRELFHLPSVAEIRVRFAKRDEGDDRNRWLYSYNPLTVELM